MNAFEMLAAIQRQTNTKAIPWSEDCYRWFFNHSWNKMGGCDPQRLKDSIDATVQELYACQLPTKYESSLHYPTLSKLLTELYAVRNKAFVEENVIDSNIPKPLIGSADFGKIQAFADPKHNLIVIDRSLCYFLSGIAELIVDIVTTYQEGHWVIRPSQLDYQSIKQKIKSSQERCSQFTEIMAAYVIFRGTWPSEEVNYDNEEKFLWHETIALEVWRFVVSHELAHILLEHEKSTQFNEYQADLIGALLCTVTIHLNEHLRVNHVYWAMAITAKALDILHACNDHFYHLEYTHPPDRIATINYVLKRVKADPYVLEMVRIVDDIFDILWKTIEPELKEIAELWNDGILSTIEQVKQYIAYIPWN